VGFRQLEVPRPHRRAGQQAGDDGHQPFELSGGRGVAAAVTDDEEGVACPI